MKNTTRKDICALALGLSIIAAIIWISGPKEILSEFNKLTTESIAILLAIQLSIHILHSIKLYIITDDKKAHYRNILAISLTAYMANSITPLSYAGGEPLKAYLLSRKENITSQRSISIIYLDLLLDMVPIIILTIMASIISICYFSLPQTINIILIGTTIISISALIVMVGAAYRIDSTIRILNPFLIMIQKILPKRYLKKTTLKEYIREISDCIQEEISDKSIMIKALILSFMIRTTTLIRTIVILSILGISGKTISIIIARTLTDAIALFSVIPGALGIWEASGTILFSAIGIPTTVALSASLIDRIYAYWFSNIIGMLALASIGIKYTKYSRHK